MSEARHGRWAAVQRPGQPQRSAVSAATCDSAASIAAERTRLASVARTLADVSSGAGQNAYTTSEIRSAPPAATVAAPNASAGAAASSMIANANKARVELWYAEARQDRNEYQGVVSQIAALDAAARTLPTTKACLAAGFATAAQPNG